MSKPQEEFAKLAAMVRAVVPLMNHASDNDLERTLYQLLLEGMNAISNPDHPRWEIEKYGKFDTILDVQQHHVDGAKVLIGLFSLKPEESLGEISKLIAIVEHFRRQIPLVSEEPNHGPS